MATIQKDSPGSGMRIGPFVLDVAAMGSRRQTPQGAGAPIEVPIPTPDPEETAEMPSLAALTFLERRAVLEAERQIDDLPPPLPEGVEEEVMGVLDSLTEDATPVAPSVVREPATPTRETAQPAPAEARAIRRSPLTPRAETRATRDYGRFPTGPTGLDGGVVARRGGGTSRGAGASGVHRVAPSARGAPSRAADVGTSYQGASGRVEVARAASRNGTTESYDPATARSAAPRTSSVPRPTTGVRGGPGMDQSATMRTVGARGSRPASGRDTVARSTTATVSRVASPRDAVAPDVGRSALGVGAREAREAREWTPARNVRDAQARAAAARAKGATAEAASRARPTPPPSYTPREPQYQLRVRAAIMADRDACGAIDTTYTTDSVWQLDQRQDDNEIRIGLRQISLPKPMAANEPMNVPFVSHADTLWLVAEELEVPPTGRETTSPTVGTVVGFLTATIEPRREMVYLRAVAVARDYRRQHLGSALIEHMRRWAAREGVPEITADVSAKNAPALRLLQRSGFRFCGYSNRLYRNGEVALFLAAAVR